jgi:uncharacterized membrane protein YcfT
MKHYLQIGWRLEVPVTGLWGTLGDQLLTIRMPLFFTISGMFAVGALHRPWRVAARSRLVTFLYLYALWASVHGVLLSFAPGFDTTRPRDLAEFAGQLLITPPNLWYLYALALYFAVAKALRRMPPAVLLTAALALSVIVATGVLPEAGNRGQVLQNLVFFLAGLHLRPHLERLAATTGGRRAALAGLGYALALLAMAATGSQRVPGVWPAVCALAIVFGVRAAPLLAAVPVLGDGLARLGRRTLPIYVIHMPVLALLHEPLAGPLAAAAGTGRQYVLAAVHPIAMTALIVALCLLAEKALRGVRAAWLFEVPTVTWVRCPNQLRQRLSRSSSSRTTK